MSTNIMISKIFFRKPYSLVNIAHINSQIITISFASFSFGKENFVKVPDALFNFETFTSEHDEYFNNCPQIIDYFGQIIEIHCEGWEVMYGCK